MAPVPPLAPVAPVQPDGPVQCINNNSRCHKNLQNVLGCLLNVVKIVVMSIVKAKSTCAIKYSMTWSVLIVMACFNAHTSRRDGHFFANRVINVWNSLPDQVVVSPTVMRFKSKN